MKLTGTQINALARSFYEKLEEKNKKEHSKKIEQEKLKHKDLYNNCMSILKKNDFLKELNTNITFGKVSTSLTIRRNSTFNSIFDNYAFRNAFEKNLPSIESIKQDIILATIDSKSVEDIMNSLNKKYK
jgi:hypothetical protein